MCRGPLNAHTASQPAPARNILSASPADLLRRTHKRAALPRPIGVGATPPRDNQHPDRIANTCSAIAFSLNRPFSGHYAHKSCQVDFARIGGQSQTCQPQKPKSCIRSAYRPLRESADATSRRLCGVGTNPSPVAIPIARAANYVRRWQPTVSKEKEGRQAPPFLPRRSRLIPSQLTPKPCRSRLPRR